MITSELKPCPFCGGKARMYINQNHDENCYVAWVRCGTVGCNAIIQGDEKPLTFGMDEAAKLSALAKWNRRKEIKK